MFLWFLATTTLLACVATGEQVESPEAPDETVLTQPNTADPAIAGEMARDDSGDESDPRPSGESPAGCLEEDGHLVVTGSDGRVTVIDSKGESRIELRGPVRPGHPGLQPTWSPICQDGGRVIAWTEANEDGSFVVALADTTTTQVHRHPSPVAAFYYYWSPDAKLLAFLGQNAFSPIQLGILTVQSGEVEIVGEGQPFYFDWHPHSDAIVAHIGNTLSLVDRRENSWSVAQTPLTPGLFQAPAWVSPDRIMMVAPASPGMVNVNNAGGIAQADPPAQRLTISDLEGVFVTTLADLEGPVAFSPHPTGLSVAYSEFGGPLRVLDVGQRVPVALTERRVAAFQWNADGSRLLFIEVDADAKTLVPRVWDGDQTTDFAPFFPTQAFLLQYLPFWDQYSRSLTLWAPDGEAFTYSAASSDRNRIMVQHLDERLPTEVAEGVFASWAPSLG